MYCHLFMVHSVERDLWSVDFGPLCMSLQLLLLMLNLNNICHSHMRMHKCTKNGRRENILNNIYNYLDYNY